MNTFTSESGIHRTAPQQVKVDKVIDARGIYCPGPLVELIRVMRLSSPGTIFEVLSSDRISTKDIPDWVNRCGHEYIGIREKADSWSLYIRKNK
ncbi:MAG: sulfurtransferase TusA family protein [Deltaproteobacteria bacterium]|nr:sulfurtransferase TusA family protein [Deltaproteobacteria bacterium]